MFHIETERHSKTMLTIIIIIIIIIITKTLQHTLEKP